MTTRPVGASEGEAPAAPDTEHDLTPSPGSLERTARISQVADVVNVPVAWLDRLLSIGAELPFDQGEDGVVGALVGTLERLFPGVRVAIPALPLAAGAPDLGLSIRRVQWTEPPKSDERLRPARVFPGSAHERSVILPGPGNRALHFASDADLFGSDGSAHVQAMDRAAVVVAQALARARSEARTTALQAELHTAEAQVIQAEKLAGLGQIAAGMVHELNNPLTSIAAYTDFLLRRAAQRPATDADDVERLRRIAESANRMLRFTRDLVSYARPSGDVPIAVQLNGVIDRALAFCEHEISHVGAEVVRAYDADIGPVRGMPEQLAQVFVNLVTNACHAMASSSDASDVSLTETDESRPIRRHRAPALTVSTTASGGGASPDGASDGQGQRFVTVTVQDNGCGISRDHLAKIFTPFFTTKASGHGTGLGLSIVKKIVDGHHGDIRAESDSGGGTRFILRFPVDSG